MNFASWHAPLIMFSHQSLHMYSTTMYHRTSSITQTSRKNRVKSLVSSPGCSSLWKFLPAANPVPEFFSHNTQSSHPELSVLDYLSSRANKSLGMLSEAGGRSLLSRWDVSWHLLFPSLCHTTKGAEGRHTKPESAILKTVTDHLRMYYTLLPKHDQKP